MVPKLPTFIALAFLPLSLALPNRPANCPAPGVQCCMSVLDKKNEYAVKALELAHAKAGRCGSVALSCTPYVDSCPNKNGIVCCNDVYYNGLVAVGCERVA